MKLLFCVEFYFPSLGGAQEVVRQLAERMAARGHDVSVATTRLKARQFHVHKGVRIEEFAVAGNQVRGFEGEVDRYRDFLVRTEFDLVLFYAAQQWTFDAAWQVMDRIHGKKVLVPCGYSALHNLAYARYFAELPDVLRKCDHIIYHASEYRDVAFGCANRLDHYSIIPNGADDVEFSVPKDTEFRRRHNVPAHALVLLTVGTVTGLKGHSEVLSAFERASFGERSAVLFLNGNEPESDGTLATPLRDLFGTSRLHGWRYALKHAAKQLLWKCGIKIGKSRSVAVRAQAMNQRWRGEKRVVACDFTRSELVQAYMNADLFVFASNIEYSPLVLFEACAAGLPFLSVPVGNANEIAAWTGGGEICPAATDDRGYTKVSADDFARRIEVLVADPERLVETGARGRMAWQRRFNWERLAHDYEALFVNLVNRDQPAKARGLDQTSPVTETGAALE